MEDNEKRIGYNRMKRYLDSLEFVADLTREDLIPDVSESNINKTSNIFIMRHGERADFSFGKWEQHCFDEKGHYHQKDLNLPESLPERDLGPLGYRRDTPITNVGKFHAQAIGKCFKAKNIEIGYVYCSPAFRCLQTCDAFLKGFNKQLKIRVEPALFEWVPWIGAFPSFMTTNELNKAGFNIDSDYKSFTSMKELKENSESMEGHYQRGHDFMKKIIETHPSSNILLVGHASTLDTCSRNLLNGKWLSPEELLDLCKNIEYCSLVRLTSEGGIWKFAEPPCPPMSYSSTKQFDWKSILQKY